MRYFKISMYGTIYLPADNEDVAVADAMDILIDSRNFDIEELSKEEYDKEIGFSK